MKSNRLDMGKRRNTMPMDIWESVNVKTTTQCSIIFLCLFDGLRIPTIRRLSRKPQTICFEPLNNFDPSLYSPTTTNIFTSRYQNQLHIPSTSVIIDPTIPEVQSVIRTVANRTSRERAILHYYGMGSHEPSSDGKMYFFDKTRTSYRSLTVTRLLESSESPITMIIDCGSAGALRAPLEKLSANRDIVAFFSCADGENLPSATNMPLDILSSSILDPLESAIWFHSLSAVKPHSVDFAPNVQKEMGDYLSAVLDSIALSVLPPNVYMQLFDCDESLSEISKGFILATRLLAYSNVHTVSIPRFPPTEESPQWGLWDTYLDAVTSGVENPICKIFDEVKITFKNFNHHSLVPILIFFLMKADYQEETTELLLNYIENVEIVPAPCQNGIAQAITKIKKPTKKHFLILAKLYLAGLPPKPDINKLLGVQSSDVLSVGMLALCCCIEKAQLTNQVQLLQACAKHANDCAPFSALLFGLIVSKMTLFSVVPIYCDSFIPLLHHEREDIRAAAAFALGFTRDHRGILPLCHAAMDHSDIVASEALISLSMLMRFDPAKIGLSEETKKAVVDAFSSTISSTREIVLNMARNVQPFIQNFVSFCGLDLPQSGHSNVKIMPSSKIPALLYKAVPRKGFIERIHSNIFI
ncbi:hypothetical protein TRFO_28089 [Tritrichomonas foetus]|uniref:Raptor N-terminal CASPase-like domain-containing protein n=1 Tax=Tritrichomonas foetus TaxID=1144522 RepID=A0A1J4K3R4_9EUKA|nr:hypothetical protein TRFO_28089 [Tritrichomonas foetus]|eukprot:OHT04388.1 hypothetical protein TRFO_28089 [Tritrichomonas foetus]